ncbi:MAG: 4Fe-4S dicluster domain-containing protein [Actinomycetaceae bacterium]|nr:4Fe-4S dicluster domain-containing protein [Actinomycetaceae bacterium]MDY5854919.1 ferredoxin family protein [Arcanobacterium sp.]
MSLPTITVRVEEYIGVNKYEVDEENPHIVLKGEDYRELSDEEFGKLVRVCPAALYKQDPDGERRFDYAGCVECGTCRIVAEDTILEKWNYPGPLSGIQYRYG